MPQLIVSSPTGPVLVPISVVKLDTPAGAQAMKKWHRDIQLPFIDALAKVAPGRADAGWNWPRALPWINRLIWVQRQRNFSFALVARNASGTPVTVALAVGIQPFACLEFPDGRRPIDGFVWYITGIPQAAASKLGLPGVKVTAQSVAICKRICQAAVPTAEIVLHADPRGPSLLQFYAKKCMMNQIPSNVVIRAPRKRANDGRFFYSGSP